MMSDWSLLDFVISGTFTPRSHLQRLLGKVIEEANAERAVLLARAHGRRSLIVIAAGKVEDLGKSIEVQAIRSGLRRLLLRAYSEVVEGGSTKLKRQYQCSAFIQSLTDSRADTFIRFENLSVKTKGSKAIQQNACVAVIAESGKSVGKIDVRLKADLFAAVWCMEEVAIGRATLQREKRDLKLLEVSRQVEDHLGNKESPLDFLQSNVAFEEYLNLIEKLLDSHQVAIYARVRGKGFLSLRAASNGGKFLSEIPIESRSPIARSFKERKCFIERASPQDEFNNMLLCPLMEESFFCDSTHCSGVLIAYRQADFGIRDIASIHFLSVFISQAQARSWSHAGIATIEGILTSGIESRTSETGRTNIATWLEVMGRLTNSRSVSLRMLDRSRVALQRMMTFPKQKSQSEYHSIRLVDKSIVCGALIEGESMYLPNIPERAFIELNRNRYSYLLVRSGVKSELAVPLFSFGRSVGVLNLEHENKNAYREWEWLVKAIAGAIAIELSAGEQAAERQLFNFASSLVLSVHDVFQCQRLLSNTQQLNKGDLATVKMKLDLITASHVQATSGDIETAPAKLRTLFDKCQPILENWNPIFCGDVDLLEMSYSIELTRFLSVCLREILINALKHASLSSGFTGRLGGRRRARDYEVLLQNSRLGGKKVCRLQFSFARTIPVDREVLANIYYETIVKDKSRHFGAFMIGASARSHGVDIGVDFSRVDNRFTTILDIPESQDRLH